MTGESALTIDRNIEEVKAQVKRELESLREAVGTFNYRRNTPDWRAPFQLHRLRRALRIHYLAYNLRNTTPVPKGTEELKWELEDTYEQF
ncbi:MAG: hypothetical protein ACXADO_07800 [Candidatus Thorarchaeota archaeon]|jgi:hypothetical protein